MDSQAPMRISPTDPIWSVKAIANDVNKETIAKLREMLTEHMDQISATMVQAETAAKARGEKLITEGMEWSATRIRDAGDAASMRFVAETQRELADAKKELRRATNALWFATAAAACAAIGTFAVLWL